LVSIGFAYCFVGLFLAWQFALVMVILFA